MNDTAQNQGNPANQGEGQGDTANQGGGDANQYVSASDFHRFTEQQNAQINRLAESMQLIGNFVAGGIGGQQQHNQPIPKPGPTDEEIEQAIEEGKAASVIRGMMDDAVNSRVATLENEIKQLRTDGATSIGNIQIQNIRQLPYYNDFKDDIDASISQLTPEQRSNPDVLMWVYNGVVGANAKKLVEIEKEKVLRRQNLGGDGSTETPTQHTGRGQSNATGDKVPTVRELLGADAAAALASKNQTEDDLARRMNYSSWAEYAKYVQAYQRGEVYESPTDNANQAAAS